MLKPLLEHLFPSLILGIAFSFYFKEWSLIIIALSTGWLVDFDHLLDYFKAWKVRGFSRKALTSIFAGNYFLINNRVYVILHAWEWIIIWFFGWSLAGRFDVALTGATSLMVHLSMDHLSYKLHRHAYFITYRIIRGFDSKMMEKEL